MYGITHVCARDGYLGMVVAFVVIPVENNMLIYDTIFRYDFAFNLNHMFLFTVKLIVKC